MNLEQVLERIASGHLPGTITAWHRLPSVSPQYGGFPSWMAQTLQTALSGRGITDLYTHQRAAVDLAYTNRSVVVVTPTASGKTLCYNIPVVQRLIEDRTRRALYLFPTKALAQDQLAELQSLLDTVDDEIKVHTYDGDTPGSARSAIRAAAHIVVTNPDMLHTGILPHHTRWMRLFENLDYVVIDELHQYRGVFGSHVANVVRRLRRICEFYGSSPTFILCSATIANPAELAADLIGESVVLCDQSGAPAGERNIIMYNPPVVNARLGIRRSSLLEAVGLAALTLNQGISTIVFGRSRLSVELMLTYLRRSLGPRADLVRGYRGGYLPRERREIERGLRDGSILGVVATNALELGIDIGGLQVAILAGYPGTIASAWQQSGRAGRRTETSAAVMIASSSPLDQYIVNHPAYFFGRSPEHGLVSPDNLEIWSAHVKCAAFELPFLSDEQFGPGPTPPLLDQLADQRILRATGGRYYWMAESFPAEDVSLRSAATDNVVIIEREAGTERVIGEVDRFSAPLLVHDQAIYIHAGVQYQVEKLDLELNRAFVTQTPVDYYTDANLAVNLSVLSETGSREYNRCFAHRGEVSVTALATIYKKIKLHTHENVGWGKIHLPEQILHTGACWWAFSPELIGDLPPSRIESAVDGIARAAEQIAPLLLMSDARDVGAVPQVRSPHTNAPTVFMYDRYPGGLGLAHKLYELTDQLWPICLDLVSSCSCSDGCPSCILGSNPDPDKQAVCSVLSRLAGRTQ